MTPKRRRSLTTFHTDKAVQRVFVILEREWQSITSKELFNNRQSFIYNDTILLIIKKKDNPKPTTNQTKSYLIGMTLI